ncbi:MAG: serine hydrolase domain-containing protein [Bryobacteraceae bacterium]
MKENEAELAAAVRQIKGLNVNDSDIHAHVMLPPHLLVAFSDRGKEDVPISHHPPGRLHNELNVQGFISAIESALTSLCAGYSLRLRQNGVTTLATANWNWAKQPPDGSESWTPDVRVNVASLSKIVTAIAMTKVLNDHGMSYDTPIIDFLPEYWIKGPNVNEITFAQLMTHKSGLAFNNTTSQSDFQFMKAQVAAGTTYLDQFSYQNMNFGLFRILISTINGNIAVSFPFDNDELWDSSTLSAYQAYVNSNLFSPSGVTGATLYHEPADALAYTFPVSGNGWNSGDLTFQAGGNGWHMTVDQFLALMSTFRYSGAIMSQEDAQTLLGNNFGIDFSAETSLGPYYAKLGGLSHTGGYMEQSIAFYLPRQMELVVFVNSPIGVALPGQLLSYSDTGFSNNLSNPVVVGLGGWGAFQFLVGGRNVPGEDRIYAVTPSGQLWSYGDCRNSR